MREKSVFTSHRLVVGWFVIAVGACGAVVPALGQTAEIRLTALSSASGSDTAATVPASAPFMLNDTAFVVEVWAQTSSLNGLSSVSMDMTFATALADVTAITHTATFNVLTHGSIDNPSGFINDLSGSHLGPCTDVVGAAPNWTRAAILNVTPSANGALPFQSGPTGSAVYGTAVCGVGDLADAAITFGSVTVTLVDCVTNSDCDDGLYCNGMETCDAVTHTCQAGTPPNCDDGVACTIDACNETTDSCTHAPNNSFCDNGLFCDGAEFCDPLLGCRPGQYPCTNPAFPVCDEVNDVCVECLTAADCDDGLYCNGAEACNTVTHTCQAGTVPNCDDGVACTIDTCNETSDSCDHTPNDAFCDNGLWCDGAESCHVTLGCQPGSDPCTDACEHCDEDADTCEWCVLDLDANAVMGTGDFARFAGCFGGCYLPADSCYQSNFDGSVDGCVGSSDFAAFAGCFGFTCAECVACGGPAGNAAASMETSLTATPLSNVAIRVAVVEQPSVSDSGAAPPPSVIYTNVGKVLFVELWASRKDCLPGDSGLAAVYVDLDYNPWLLSILEVVHENLFSNFAGGVDNGKGTVSQFGGCAALGERELGVGTWVRVATMRVRTKGSGKVALVCGPSDALHGVAILGDFENVPIDRIEFGRATIKTQQAKEIGSQLLRGERSR